ncbi:metallophosphoesterase family protein [Pedobacter sp. SAFR-022]|uniref:metallophosphoesterase family protein n=1 Tax=Pedobacter sp. SAFR-022 TaxID=3436861 RepID=UPI003F809924
MMMEETAENKIRIAAMADIHVKETDKGRFADCFKEISGKADVLIIAGDLTDTGDEGEAAILIEELKQCSIPVLGVLGNHDYEKGRHKLIRQMLQDSGMTILDGESIVVKGVGFAGVKGFGGGFDKYMLSMFGEGAMKAFVQEAVDEALHLERALAKLDQQHENIKKIAILHYAPIFQTIVGEPEVIYPFLGSSRLAEPLSRQNVIAAFHGHAHAGTLEGEAPGGVKVFNVALPILRKHGYPCGYYTFEV